ncbi:hypothetical protein ACIRP7_34955 [Streptomyces sp. NPDC102270]|uniref:hypothetical protein n=1 Tax=Streptomyces sp. NPDC102270 TaxID=3366150 RepID=UPI003815DA01
MTARLEHRDDAQADRAAAEHHGDRTRTGFAPPDRPGGDRERLGERGRLRV